MENWAKSHIEKNLPVLLKVTTCSSALKYQLLANNVINELDIERLTATGRREGNMSEAMQLYDIIIQSSNNLYRDLLTSFDNAGQDEAFGTLKCHIPDKTKTEQEHDYDHTISTNLISEWTSSQKEHVCSYLENLVSAVNISVSLVAELRSRRLITLTDQIQLLVNNPVVWERSGEYDTRLNVLRLLQNLHYGYSELLDAFKATNQSGVCDILRGTTDWGMKDWERKVITQNLVKLVQNTNCDRDFLKCLRNEELIDDCEMETILSLGGYVHSAMKMYYLLMSRTDGYRGVRDALRETYQTLPLLILPDHKKIMETKPTGAAVPLCPFESYEAARFYIQSNMDKLITLTRSNTTLKAYLLEKYVLKWEDYFECSTQDPVRDAIRVYQLIVMQETSAYNILLNALQCTSQTGAYGILMGLSKSGMEDWQIDYIFKNITELVENTNCEKVLVEHLLEKNVLSDEEKHDLMMMRQTRPPEDAALELYEIVMTRNHGYGKLMEALSVTNQDIPWKILLDGMQYASKTSE